MAHLTRSQRDQLQALKCAKQKQQKIAGIIGCSQSTDSRELRRNSSLVQHRYTASKAQKRSEGRRQKSYDSRPRWYEDEDLLKHVEEKLIDGKSPDQIAGRMKQQGRKHTVSHQSIYDYIEKDKEEGGNLYLCLRYQGKKHKWRGLGSDKTKIPNRNDISERPEEVDSKERSGDWESDLAVSNKQGKGAVATFAERTCLCFRAVLVKDQSSD